MEVNRDLVEYIAGLAHLDLSDEEVDLFVRQLGDILHYFEKIRDVETDVLPDIGPESSPSAVRPDLSGRSLSSEEALQNAPEHSGLFFKVPRVIP